MKIVTVRKGYVLYHVWKNVSNFEWLFNADEDGQVMLKFNSVHLGEGRVVANDIWEFQFDRTMKLRFNQNQLSQWIHGKTLHSSR